MIIQHKKVQDIILPIFMSVTMNKIQSRVFYIVEVLFFVLFVYISYGVFVHILGLVDCLRILK